MTDEIFEKENELVEDTELMEINELINDAELKEINELEQRGAELEAMNELFGDSSDEEDETEINF